MTCILLTGASRGIGAAAREVDQSMASGVQEVAGQVAADGKVANAAGELTDAAVKAAAAAGVAANKYLKPQDRIPGWTEINL